MQPCERCNSHMQSLFTGRYNRDRTSVTKAHENKLMRDPCPVLSSAVNDDDEEVKG